MHNVLKLPARAEHSSVCPSASMLRKKLNPYYVAVICVRNDALFVFAVDIVGKGYVVGKIIFVESDNFLVRVPASE